MQIIEQARDFYRTNDKYVNINSLEMFDKCVEIYKENYLSPVVKVDNLEFNNWLSLDLLKGNKEFSLLDEVTKIDDKIKLYFANNILTRKIREDYINNLVDNRSACKDIPTVSIKELKIQNEIIKEFQDDIRKMQEKGISEYDVIDEFNLNFFSGSLFIDMLKLSNIEVRELYNKLQEIKNLKEQ
jgi:hypothetical protein